MLQLPNAPVSINITCHCLGTSKGFAKLPMFLARKFTGNNMFLEVKGKILLSRNKFERRQLEKLLPCY